MEKIFKGRSYPSEDYNSPNKLLRSDEVLEAEESEKPSPRKMLRKNTMKVHWENHSLDNKGKK